MRTVRKLFIFSSLLSVFACAPQTPPVSTTAAAPKESSIFGVSATDYFTRYFYVFTPATADKADTYSYLRTSGFENNPIILEPYAAGGKNLYARFSLTLSKDKTFEIFYEELVATALNDKLQIEGSVFVGTERGSWKIQDTALMVGEFLSLRPYSMTENDRLLVKVLKPLHNEKLRGIQGLLERYEGSTRPGELRAPSH